MGGKIPSESLRRDFCFREVDWWGRLMGFSGAVSSLLDRRQKLRYNK